MITATSCAWLDMHRWCVLKSVGPQQTLTDENVKKWACKSLSNIIIH